MPFLPWTEKMRLGVHDMDDQHIGLIDAMNTLHERATADASHGELVSLVDRLVTLTTEHFAQEEAFMQSIGFRSFPVHKAIHTSLLAQLAEHRDAVAATGAVPLAFFDFLKLWLTAHICGIDTKYAEVAHAA